MNCIYILGRCIHISMLSGYNIPCAYSCDLQLPSREYVRQQLLLLRGGYAD